MEGENPMNLISIPIDRKQCFENAKNTTGLSSGWTHSFLGLLIPISVTLLWFHHTLSVRSVLSTLG